MCISTLSKSRPSQVAIDEAHLLKAAVLGKRSERIAARPASSSKASKRKHQHETVQHNYHDHSHDAAPRYLPEQELTARGNAAAPFPLKLYDMLERVEEDGFADVVSWQPHGRCFVVHKPDQFKAILPRYFTLSKIASFQRQLNLYGFMRLSRGLDKGGYYHEHFLRGKAFLIRKILRVKIKGTKVRQRSNPEQEPHFWSMEWVGGEQPQQTPSIASNNRQGRASVVSHDEEESTDEEPEAQRQVEIDECSIPAIISMEEDLPLMSGWGKPFYLLDHLPEEIVAPAPPLSSSSSALETPTAANSASSLPPDFSEMDEFFSKDMGELVEEIMGGQQESDENFMGLLEKIIEQ